MTAGRAPVDRVLDMTVAVPVCPLTAARRAAALVAAAPRDRDLRRRSAVLAVPAAADSGRAPGGGWSRFDLPIADRERRARGSVLARAEQLGA